MVNIRINWKSGELPVDLPMAEAQIRRELEDLTNKTEIWNLFFHTVFLGETMDDESVFVTPTDGDPMAVDCWYSEKTLWQSIGKIDDGDHDAVVRMHRDMMEGPLPDSASLVDGEI